MKKFDPMDKLWEKAELDRRALMAAGAATGGPLETYTSPFFGVDLKRPADPQATYGWTEWDKSNPTGNTSLDDLGASWFLAPGQGVDFAEWYFASRLPLDVGVAGTLVLKDNDWPVSAYGLRAMRGAEMDLPVLGLSARLVGGATGDPKPFFALRTLLANAPIGSGRPLAGTARTDDRAFRVASAGGLTHIDPLTGADRDPSQAKAWYDLLAAWLRLHTPAEGVQIPVQPAK